MAIMVTMAGLAQPLAKGNTTMIRYHAFLKNKLNELRTDEATFFRMAHVFFFGSDPDLSTDVAQFKLHAIIPRYVMRYLDHLAE